MLTCHYTRSWYPTCALPKRPGWLSSRPSSLRRARVALDRRYRWIASPQCRPWMSTYSRPTRRCPSWCRSRPKRRSLPWTRSLRSTASTSSSSGPLTLVRETALYTAQTFLGGAPDTDEENREQHRPPHSQRRLGSRAEGGGGENIGRVQKGEQKVRHSRHKWCPVQGLRRRGV